MYNFLYDPRHILYIYIFFFLRNSSHSLKASHPIKRFTFIIKIFFFNTYTAFYLNTLILVVLMSNQSGDC